ncbi:MAG: leucyl aminopeptidase [Chloroflexi bacterium]|nr:leucyl aminopeptidase [Chloroflexota bacterium]
MELRVIPGDIREIETDCAVVTLFEGMTAPAGATGALDDALGGYIRQLIADGEIKGKRGEMTLVHTQGKARPKRVLVVGLGKQERLDAEVVRGVGGEAARYLRRKGFQRVASIVPGAGEGGLGPADAAQALAEGVLLGLYRFRTHFSRADEEDGREISELCLVERDRARLPAIEKGIERGRIIAQATALARDLVNEPANYMTPTILAERARAVAETYGLEFNALDRPQIEELGMGGLLGVARGSHQPPQFIILHYKGDPYANRRTMALLGKGITFDSGGISIKPAAGMAEMKGDMAGGAAVIATLQVIAQLRPPINIMGLIPATENMPGGGATKPGDILVAMNKKTIEVDNTDAEGRLVLADALAYANRLGLRPLVDMATLTGAIRTALGTICTGLFANDDDMAQHVLRASEVAGEKMWRMPLWDDYTEQIKSAVADIKNTGGPTAGAITAAQFLHEFAGETPWAHLDIAGVFMAEKDRGWEVKGATGQPVRSLVNLILDLAQRQETSREEGAL